MMKATLTQVLLLLAAQCVLLTAPGAVQGQKRIWETSQDPEVLIAEAREAANRGQHAEAISKYEAAMLLAPERSDEISAALAFQHAWAGNLGDASQEFRRARAADPADYDLRMGELLVTNWMGRHLAAWDGYAALAREFPTRPAPRVGLAAAQNWAGRRDLALATLAEARDIDSGYRETANLEQAIRRQLRPEGGVYYDWSEDSDDYQINGLWVEGGLSPHPQWRVSPFYNLLGIRQPNAPDIDENWVGLTVAARPATRIGFWGRVSWLTDKPDAAEYTPVTASLSTDVTLSDQVTVGANYERFAVVSFQTFPEKITGHVVGTFLEVRPDWRTRIRISGDYGVYDSVLTIGDNHRWNLHARGDRQVYNPWRLRAGLSGRYLDFDEVQDNGIWTPDYFWAAAALLSWDIGERDRWSVNGAVELGPAAEAGGDPTLFAVWRVGAYRVINGLVLEGYVGHSEGNVETGTGYDRTFAHAGIRRRF